MAGAHPSKARDKRRGRRTGPLLLAGAILLLPIAAASALHAPAAAAGHRGLPAPRLRRRPPAFTTLTSAYFTFTDRAHGVRFQCSLDHSRYRRCSHSERYGPSTVRVRCAKRRRARRCRTRLRYVGKPLALGVHTFRVRALSSNGRFSRPTRYRWTIEGPEWANDVDQGEERPFSITTSGQGEPLYPGDPPESVPLTIHNPNGDPLYVTALTLTVSRAPLGCQAAENLAIEQSSASESSPLLVPANGSVTLPAQGVSAPTVRMLELPVDQDGCKGAAFTFSYSGSGRS